jgi:trans-aconitate 2-methyltransferase
MSRYTYGDSELAAERLALVAKTFAQSTRAFFERVAPREPSLALDLGCGPGATTRLLHETTAAVRTIGLDASPAYVVRAAATAPAGVAFVQHDVTEMPFPTELADVVFARLLLAHLPDPSEVVARWSRGLAEGGVMLLEDLEAIDTDESACRAYLDEVATPVVRSQGGNLFVGPLLHAMADPPGTERIHEEVVSVVPPPVVSAEIFAMNLVVLEERGEIGGRPEVADGLAALLRGEREAAPVVWRMRQLAFRRGA